MQRATVDRETLLPFLLKCTLINPPPRRERKACGVFGCFSRSLINAIREAKEQSTLLLISANLASAGFALTPFVALLCIHFKSNLLYNVYKTNNPLDRLICSQVLTPHFVVF